MSHFRVATVIASRMAAEKLSTAGNCLRPRPLVPLATANMHVYIGSRPARIMTSFSRFSGSPLFLVPFHCAIRSRLFTPSCRATRRRRRRTTGTVSFSSSNERVPFFLPADLRLTNSYLPLPFRGRAEVEDLVGGEAFRQRREGDGGRETDREGKSERGEVKGRKKANSTESGELKISTRGFYYSHGLSV